MKPSLQLKIGQSLTMTPQLQQAIRLLQLSSVELQTEIQDVLDSNMMLEVDEQQTNTDSSRKEAESTETNTGDEIKTNMEKEDIPQDLEIDTRWEDIYEPGLSYTSRQSEFNTQNLFENQSSSEKSLHEHLLWQLNLTPTTETDKMIAIAIIDALDDDGYLTIELEEIVAAVQTDDPEIEIELEEVQAVLHLIQSMEPIGVGAKDLQECLTLQLNQLDKNTPWLEEAQILIVLYINLLASHDYNQIMRKMKLDKDSLQEVLNLVQSMNPRPGGSVTETQTHYVVPDVYVKKINGKWRVDLNNEPIPNLRINSTYANMIRRADNSTDNTSLKTHLQEARWFIKSLQSRSETLLKVAATIVERQRAFLDYGEEAMKPMVLSDIADALGMHESTISRVTTKKYMHTPRGVFELKYFFSSHVSTDAGGACSSTAIRALIKKLISAEVPNKPLSDNKIAAVLSDQGINVARRTVAKYREAMSIPPSNERKRLG